MNKLELLKKLEAEATSGPWTYYDKYDYDGVLAGKTKIMENRAYYPSAPDSRDMQFIAEMRNALPKLLAVAEAVCLHMDGHISWSEVSKVVRELKEDL